MKISRREWGTIESFACFPFFSLCRSQTSRSHKCRFLRRHACLFERLLQSVRNICSALQYRYSVIATVLVPRLPVEFKSPIRVTKMCVPRGISPPKCRGVHTFLYPGSRPNDNPREVTWRAERVLRMKGTARCGVQSVP